MVTPHYQSGVTLFVLPVPHLRWHISLNLSVLRLLTVRLRTGTANDRDFSVPAALARYDVPRFAPCSCPCGFGPRGR